MHLFTSYIEITSQVLSIIASFVAMQVLKLYHVDAPAVPCSSSSGGVKVSDPIRRPLFPTSPREKSQSPRNILLSPAFTGSRGKRLRQVQAFEILTVSIIDFLFRSSSLSTRTVSTGKMRLLW